MNRIDTIQQNLREPRPSDHGTRLGDFEPECIFIRNCSKAVSLASPARGYAWLDTTKGYKEISKYAGSAVAIFEDQVVASAPTTREASRTAEKLGYTPGSLIVIYVHDSRDSIDTLL